MSIRLDPPMRSKMKTVVVAFLVSLPVFGTGVAQTTRATVALRKQLESTEPRTREQAFEGLAAVPGGLSAPQMRAPLLSLLRREDDANAAALRASSGANGVPSDLGEGWAEYLTDVIEACAKYCDKGGFLAELLRCSRSDRAEIRSSTMALLREYALPRAGFSRTQRAVMDSVLLATATDPMSAYRRELGIIGVTTVLQGDPSIGKAWRTEAHAALAAATSDPNADVRVAAVRALGQVGEASDLPLLRRIAAADSARSSSSGRVRYVVRDAAARAISEIKP